MYIKTRLTLIFIFITALLIAQDVRTYDGSNNNETQTTWGAGHTTMPRITGFDYTDGYSSLAGQNRPNPRVISNAMFAQSGSLGDALNLSDYLWVFGQFLDHDVVAVDNNPAEPAMIPVDFPDPYFNPGGGYPNVMIPMFRNMTAEGTGTGIGNPRQHTNTITAFIDGSGVYGSDEERALYLRSMVDGKMKTSTGNLLPWNTIDHEKTSPLDASAPEMADDVGFSYSLFVAGDVRANEQPLLLAFHTLFVREHNRQCDIILAANPDWNDEQIYQKARKMIGGFIQSITYNQWLPAMGVHLDEYAGYDPSINPGISNEFSAAAFRLGHTLLNSTIRRMDNQGNIIPEGNLSLAEGFFNPAVVYDLGMDPYFKGMATQTQQELDCNIIDDVRNFLFGPPGSGGLDLASININRGRERGLPDINTMRSQLGLTPYSDFSDLNPDPEIFEAVASLYDNVDDIDPWVGMLAEDHIADALFGETIMTIMEQQFYSLRDGDRFFYLNDDGLSADEKMEISSTMLRDIIMRNTEVQLMQENVFLATPHSDLCNATEPEAEIYGSVTTVSGAPVSNASFSTQDIDGNIMANGEASNGTFSIPDLSTCNYYNLTGSINNTDFRAGVSTLDIVLISRHLIGLQPITSNPLLVASDVNGDNEIGTFDLIDLQKLILFIDNEFPNNTPSWDLLPDEEAAGSDPFTINIANAMQYDLLQADLEKNWIAFKIGNVSGNDILPGVSLENEERSQLVIGAKEQLFKQGEIVNLSFNTDQLKKLYGLQGSFQFDQLALKYLGTNEQAGLSTALDGELINWQWFQSVIGEDVNLSFEFVAQQDGRLSEAIQWISEKTLPLATTAELQEVSAAFTFGEAVDFEIPFQVFQNQPNPAAASTQISWLQPEASSITLEIIDQSGKRLLQKTIDGLAGRNFHQIDVLSIGAQGLLYYRINSPFGSQTEKMLVLAE